MANKPAAKKAASSNNVTDKQAEKAFAEPDKYEGVDQPAESLSPAESLQRDHDRADELEQHRKLNDKANEDLDEKREHVVERWSAISRYKRAEVQANIPVVDGDELSVATVDGRVYVEVGGKTAILDREGAINLGRQVDSAHQAVA